MDGYYVFEESDGFPHNGSVYKDVTLIYFNPSNNVAQGLPDNFTEEQANELIAYLERKHSGCKAKKEVADGNLQLSVRITHPNIGYYKLFNEPGYKLTFKAEAKYSVDPKKRMY